MKWMPLALSPPGPLPRCEPFAQGEYLRQAGELFAGR